jgi:hypothetical protein
MIFFLPLEMAAFTGNHNPYTATKSPEEFKEAHDIEVPWDRRQLYINPQNFSIREQKIVKNDLTKGGYVVQYWGEQLPVIEAGGTTGSAGVEGINILRDIYRHEQIRYRQILARRQRAMAQAAANAAAEAEAALYEDNAGGFFLGAADLLTGGAASAMGSGVVNAVDLMMDPFQQDTAGGRGTFRTVPTLAAFATNIDLYYQGEFFRGYFSSFSTTENASEPGHFTYQFSFTVTRRTGRRENFMPWHREPSSIDGETVMSQKTTVSKGSYPGSDALSFKTREGSFHGEWNDLSLNEDNSIGISGYVDSKFKDDNIKSSDKNSVPHRKAQIKKGSS